MQIEKVATIYWPYSSYYTSMYSSLLLVVKYLFKLQGMHIAIIEASFL